MGNQVANVAIKDGKVLSFGHSFPKATSVSRRAPETVDDPTPTVPVATAIATAEKALGVSKNEIEPFTRYVETADGKYELAWAFQLQSKPGSKNLKWYEVDVSAKSGKIISVVNWVNDASYTVVDFTATDPNPTKDTITVKDPAKANASPNGWHTSTETRGNNAYVYRYSGRTKKTASGGANNVYSAKYDATKAPDTANNQAAALANNFYVTNSMHDLFYQYGFNEKSGNFQADNYGKGGRASDAVSVSVQDPDGTNNANFATPPDGQTPQMNMYIFTETTPHRDGTLENDIIIHEYGHGISNRLTGGPSNSGCLRTLEAGGMGEGWSDAMAIFLQRKATHTRDTDLTMGSWVTGDPKGIRKYPYSTNTQRNPHTYASVGKLNEVHNIGEVWATLWNEVYFNLVDQAGFSDDWFNANQEKGNVVAMQLLTDGLALQPCNPSMVAARDAILQADQNRYNGKYKCAIWKGFAKRGLGTGAVASKKVDSFDVPAECK